MTGEKIDLGGLGATQVEIAAGGRTAVMAAVDGRAVAVIGIADAVRPTSVAPTPPTSSPTNRKTGEPRTRRLHRHA